MDILEFIGSDVLDRYARWIAVEDMVSSGLHVKLLIIDREKVSLSNNQQGE